MFSWVQEIQELFLDSQRGGVGAWSYCYPLFNLLCPVAPCPSMTHCLLIKNVHATYFIISKYQPLSCCWEYKDTCCGSFTQGDLAHGHVVFRTESNKHSQRNTQRVLWEHKGCQGGDHLFCWWGFSAETPMSIIKPDLQLDSDTQRFWDSVALQSVNFLPVNVSFKYVVYFLFGELLFLFITFFSYKFKSSFFGIVDIILSYLMQVFLTGWFFFLLILVMLFCIV